MFVLKHGAVFFYFMLIGDVLKAVGGVELDRSLFFNGPLPDSLGKYKDQERVTLTCGGGSRNGQLISYKWFKGSKEITTASFPRYIAKSTGHLDIFPSNYRKDDGFYQCKVTDTTVEKWSLLSNFAELRIAYMSGTTKADVTVTGIQGQPWKYVFSAYGHSKYPKPTFIWKFKGQVLKETERISVSENGDLYIAQLSFNDAGKYTFEIRNGLLTQKRESITLKISRSQSTSDISAVFTLEPKSRKVSLKREKDFTFECFASGKPMPRITWKRSGRNLYNGEKYLIKDFNKRLTVRHLNVADSGKYRCEITRAAVKSSSEATLTVIDPPVIDALEPKSKIAHIGMHILLTCMVKGGVKATGFSQTWYRNGVRLSHSSHINMRMREYRDYFNYTLNITKLSKTPDAGMYQCFAKNDGGEAMAYAAIDVQILAPNITFGPGVVYVVLGKPAWIRCIARGSPPITFTWEKNGQLINSDNGKNGTYIIKSVKRGDIAQYACIARNGPRQIDQARSSGVLELVVPPVVVNKSSVVYAPKGSYPYLYSGVRFDRKINVTYRWYFKDYLVRGGKKEVGYDGRLIIKGVSEQDQGVYRCDIRSAVGNYSTTVELVVQAPPYAPSVPQVDQIRPDSVRLLWKAGYDGNSAIHYFRIGLKYAGNNTEVVYINRAMPSGFIKKYVVPGLTPSTRYQFRIQAENGVGHSPWSGYSKVAITGEAAPTHRLRKITGKAVAADTIDVEWEIPPKSTHNGVLLGYYVAWKYAGVTSGDFTSRKVTPASTNKLRITNLILNSPYEVKVQMFNRAGAGPFSIPKVVKTLEGKPSSPPRNLAVSNVSSTSVVLQWDEPPQQDWNGDLTHYIIRLWVFDKEDKKDTKKDIDQRNAPHDPSAFIQSYNVTDLKPYTQYVFTVSALNSQGGSGDSNQVQVVTTEDIPTAPQRLSIVDQFSDTISVSWARPRQVNGVLKGYVVKYWRVGNTRETKEIQVDGDALQAGVTSLRYKTRYMIEVAAKTRAGISASARIEGRTLDYPVRPQVPSNLRFFEINATALEMTWVEGSKGRSPIIKYVIEGNNETGFANDRTSQWFIALTVDEPYKIYNLPPVLIENLRPNTVYRFRVRAYNKVGASPLSLVSKDIKTGMARPTSPPIRVKVESSEHNPGELLLTWQTPPKETWNSNFIKYIVTLQVVGDKSNFSRQNIEGIQPPTTTTKLTSLKKFMLYEIRMRTSNVIGNSPYCPTIIGQTQEYVPYLSPANIRAIGASSSSINITWDAVPKGGRNGVVLGYKIFYALFQYATHDLKEIELGNVTSYLLKGLMGYTQYDIRVLAFTKIGDGRMSAALKPFPRTLETKPGPPSRLNFPVISAALVTVNWDVPELIGGNITKYRVNYKLRDEGGAKLVKRPTLDATKRSDIVLDLGADKYYLFQVQAYTSYGWGSPASAVIYTSDRPIGKAEVPLLLPISDSDITSRSIEIRWAVATRNRHPIRYFTLQLRKGKGAWETHAKPLSGDEKKLVVWGLVPNHVYTFRISATIDGNTSPFSTPSPPVRTLRESALGTPREVRIISKSPTTLTVSWKPPSLADIEGTIEKYSLGYRKHRNIRPEDGDYIEYFPRSYERSYTITGLKEYTLYDISLSAVDEFRRNLGSYLETRRTAARLPPRPSLRSPGNIGPTSVTLFWYLPSSKETSILGYTAAYKIVSNKRRRRRRRDIVRENCDKPEPGEAYFSNTSTQGTITNLNMYTNYRIVLRSYNTAGFSRDSAPTTVRTAEGVPGPPATFGFDGVYGNEVHLYWEAPCEPNGRLGDYKLTVSADAKGKIQEQRLDNDVTVYKVLGLVKLTKYKFELVATTSKGAGTAKILETTTPGNPVKPRPPEFITATAEKNTVTLTWQKGFHGYTPLTKYIIEYKTSSEKNPWTVGWRLKPSSIRRNRTDGTLWVILKDLEPHTLYWFRITVENIVATSLPSDPTSAVSTGPPVAKRDPPPFYEEIWFICVMAAIGLLILILLIVCIVCVIRRKSKRKSERIGGRGLELTSRAFQPKSSIDNLSNGIPKSEKEEKLLASGSEEEEEEDGDDEDDEERASSMETKSDVSQSPNESEDDIPTKKRQLKEALEEQDKYHPHSKPPRSFSSDNVHSSPPPAYATFAGRGNARSEPFLDPFEELDDDGNIRPKTRRGQSASFMPYDGDDSDSSDVQHLKRGDPRSSSFRRALFSGKPEPEPERPLTYKPEPASRHKQTPRKYRSLEKAVNENAKPPSYEDDDDDDVEVDVRQPSSSRRFVSPPFASPPDYRSDSGRDSSDDHDRAPLTTRSRGSYEDSLERSESPAPAYQSSTDDLSESPDRHRLINGNTKPQPEISSYSSFV